MFGTSLAHACTLASRPPSFWGPLSKRRLYRFRPGYFPPSTSALRKRLAPSQSANFTAAAYSSWLATSSHEPHCSHSTNSLILPALAGKGMVAPCKSSYQQHKFPLPSDFDSGTQLKSNIHTTRLIMSVDYCCLVVVQPLRCSLSCPQCSPFARGYHSFASERRQYQRIRRMATVRLM
jgi:hypothetical protein